MFSIFFSLIFYKRPKDTNNLTEIMLIMGGFLFTIQSFLIPFMKETLYDKEEYQKILKEFSPNNWKKDVFKPLINLSNNLSLSSLTAFLSGILALICGIFNKNSHKFFDFLYYLSLVFAIYTFLSLFHCLYLLNMNLKESFKYGITHKKQE